MELKIAFLIILVSVSNVLAIPTYSQVTKVSLNIENKSLEQVMDKIESQSEFYFIFNQKQIDVNRVVSIQVDNKLITDILPELFKGTNVNYAVFDRKILLTTDPLENNLLAIALGPGPQQKKITGTVTDKNSTPLPGVNVVITGTTQGTTTDIAGKYSFEVPKGARSLTFSFIGMASQEINIGALTQIDVIMAESVTGLEEVMVIGYGSMRKKDLTGTISRANIESFREAPNVSIIQSLQGTVAGLNVGQTKNAGEEPTLDIRGRVTISGSTSPLIVVDGIIFRGNIIDINPHDVESIDILKDASASAIYGSQASNGVLIINTKRGRDLGKPVIRYSVSYSYQLPTNKDLFPTNAEGFIKRIEDNFVFGSRLAPDYLEKDPNFNIYPYLLTTSAIDGYNAGTNTNWWNLLTRKHGSILDHNLSVSGKSNFSEYYFSVGYTDQENIIINDYYKKYSVRLNLENKITDWMKLGFQSFLTSSDYSGISPTIATVVAEPPLVLAYDSSGDPIKEPYNNGVSPLLQIRIDDLDKRLNLFGNFYVDVDIPFIKGLNYRMNYSQNLVTTRKYDFNPYDINYQGSSFKRNTYGYNWTLDNILTYKKKFNLHSINATLVYGLEKRSNENTSANSAIFTSTVLGYNSLQSGQSNQQSVSSGAWSESSLYTMGRLFYSYNDRYLVTGTIRRDGFSGFGTNNKFGVFPSLAFGWVLSEEGFLNGKVNWINNLKLRLSYGSTGNRTIGRYATLSQLSSSYEYLYGDGASAELGQWKTSLANSNLKWEETTTFNGGVDFSLFDSRLFGSFDYYKGKTSNLLYNIDIPIMNGLGNVPVNIGKIQNTGLEFTLNGIIVKKKDFNWQTTLNFSRNRNKVVSINGIDNNHDGKEDDIISSNKGNSIVIGQPYGIWYDYEIIGMWQLSDVGNIPAGFSPGIYKVNDLNNDGKYTAADDRKLIGYKDPSYRFSILNSFVYKNFGLKIFINSIQGGKNYYWGDSAPSGLYANVDNVWHNNGATWDYWMPENPNAKYRRIGSYPQSLGYDVAPLTQRSFVRLQDVSLSYNLHDLLKKLNIRTLEVFVSGKNLATWTKWDGWDPETGVGIDMSGTPVMKSYTFGLNVEF